MTMLEAERGTGEEWEKGREDEAGGEVPSCHHLLP